MRKSSRIFILLAVLQTLIVLGTLYMVTQVTSGAWHAPDPGEALRRILTVAGIAIPVFGFPFLILGISLRHTGE